MSSYSLRPDKQCLYQYAIHNLLGSMQTIVDMSCGSGLFSRRFARSGRFESVIAADFSESMLSQARTFFEEDATIDPR